MDRTTRALCVGTWLYAVLSAGCGDGSEAQRDADAGTGNRDSAIDHCAGNPCAHGTCVAAAAGYSCECEDGWNGADCEQNIDDCGGNPCVHGTCFDRIDAHTCECEDGWTGVDCERNIDDCAASPCVHGSCLDGIAGYTCECEDGWGGAECDDDVDDCAGASCVNGICVDGIDGYTCACDVGWDGAACDENIDDCAGNTCVHGSCVDGVAGYSCECDAGWDGVDCDIDVAVRFIAAINAANATAQLDVIVLGSDITLTAVDNTTDGPNGLPVITSPIVIEGNGFAISRASGAPRFRIFVVQGNPLGNGDLTLDGVVVSNGDVASGTDCSTTPDQCGGAVLNRFGLVTIRNGSRLFGNTAHAGGAVFNIGGEVLIMDSEFGSVASPNAAEFGGAVRSFGTSARVTVVNSTFTGNLAEFGGGAIYNQAALSIYDSAFDSNRVWGVPSSGSGGGAIYNTTSAGRLEIAGSAFTSNTAGRGGAVATDNASDVFTHDSVFSGNSTSGSGDGGAIWSDNNANLEIYGSLITGNEAVGNGGGIAAGRNLNSALTLVSSTLSDNSAVRDGGGMFIGGSSLALTAEVLNSVISNNAAGSDGGGIYKSGTSPLHVKGSLVSANTASPSNGDGGGMYFDNTTSTAHAHTIVATTISENQASEGAGVYSVAYTGTIAIRTSTIAGNTTITSGAVGEGGAGIANQHGTIELSNTTISGNRVENDSGALSGSGAAVHNGNGGVVDIAYCTLANNASRDGGGIRAQSTVTVANSVLANTAVNGANCNPGFTITDGGNNFVDDGTNCPAGFTVSGALDLDVLSDNGGPTRTHALLPGSVAIDAAGACGLNDQRGVSRDAECDGGAHEALAALMPLVTFEAGSSSVDEMSGGVASVNVRLDNTAGNLAAGAVEVSIRIAGTAATGLDYDMPASSYLTFADASWPAPGAAATQTLEFQLHTDDRVESDETIVLTLESIGIVGPAELGAITQHTATILDAD